MRLWPKGLEEGEEEVTAIDLGRTTVLEGNGGGEAESRAKGRLLRHLGPIAEVAVITAVMDGFSQWKLDGRLQMEKPFKTTHAQFSY